MGYLITEKNGRIHEVFHSSNTNAPLDSVSITDEQFAMIRYAPNRYMLVSGNIIFDDVLALNMAKGQKTEQVNIECERLIVSGFTSTALGALHNYQSQREDQLNLLGSVAGGIGGPFKCGLDGVWQYRAHSAAEIAQVFGDGADYKLALLQQCEALKVAIAAATNTEELGGIEIDYSVAAQ